MMIERNNRFALLGASKTGIALACRLVKAGYRPVFLWNRSSAGLKQAEKYLRFERQSNELSKISQDVDWIVMGVSDDAIENLAHSLGQALPDGTGIRVFHVSGAWDAGLLQGLKINGYSTGSFHPLVSVPDVQTGILKMEKAVFSCEGDIAHDLRQLSENIGGTGIILNAEQKGVVHLSAVFMNNFQTVSIQALKRLAESENIAKSQLATLLKTVSQQATESAWNKSLRDSLTGPVVRGDRKTIDRHLNLLADWPQLKELYQRYLELTRQLMQKELEPR